MRIVPAYAKLNLGLAVLGRRPDGFHDIDSLVVRIDWHDLVGVERAGARSLRVTGLAGAPEDDGNLALAAGAVLGPGGQRLRVWLHKRIPLEAGLGGGSADAAAVLSAGSRELQVPVPEGEAAGLGSDVPALLGGLPARVGGRGEILEPLILPHLDLVVVVAGRGSTAAAYAATGPGHYEDRSRVSALCDALRSGGAIDALMGSGLEAPAFSAAPELGAATSRLRREMPEHHWHLTGSGGALFAVVPDAAAAQRLAERARAAGWSARACHTLGH